MPPPKVSGVSFADAQAARAIFVNHVYGNWRESGQAGDSWVQMPEIPTSEEVMSSKAKAIEEEWDDYQKNSVYDPNLPTNNIDGPWSSKSEYLKAHYLILREDAVAPLRDSVASFQSFPEMLEDSDTRIYTHVYITGMLISRIGLAVRVEFSTERAGRQIRWEQSTRLLQGALVALSPAQDKFKTICKIAVVAARPILGGLDQNPPTVDLFLSEMDDEFDSKKEWVMVEARQGYFEASRHMLVGLQKTQTEKFPLATQVVGVNPTFKVAKYIESNPILDISPLLPKEVASDDVSMAGSEDSHLLLPDTYNKFDLLPESPSNIEDYQDLTAVDVIKNFPLNIDNGMDESQLLACKAMLTQRVAIVQGPPGTGKTFVSIAALRVLIQNLGPKDLPIIITAQTNHALDQLLNHVLTFEDRVVRLGGRTEKDNTEIIKRTMYELRQANRDLFDARQGMKQGNNELRKLSSEMQDIFNHLREGGILRVQDLVEQGILTEQQRASFRKLTSDKTFDTGIEDIDAGQNDDDMKSWLGADNIIPHPRAPPTHLGLPLEDVDLEFEQMQNLQEDLAALREEIDLEALQGVYIPFGRTETVRYTGDNPLNKFLKELQATKDLSTIPAKERARWYHGFEMLLMAKVQAAFRKALAKYKTCIKELEVAKGMCNYKIIRYENTKVIGCTTTGLAKYRALLAVLQPRTLLIEEAAETLEGTIAAGMVPSLNQLILVGDHKQLQASCNVRTLEEAPYNMGVSMFERLVHNNLPYVMLKKQRRMVPEVRRLLTIEPDPLYDGLTDHPTVLEPENRPPIPGMGRKNVFFFHHQWPESVNIDSSRYNSDESEMIVGFFNYLVLNGTDPSKITVLTFYNGQRKEILRDLRHHVRLQDLVKYFNVFTVDSYQGEENDIILLSLVRSNERLSIGFLENRNRAVVALSRARRGLYLFGNALTLATPTNERAESVWGSIVLFLESEGQFGLRQGLPITCEKHQTQLLIVEPADWNGLAGGCRKRCGGELPCGHACILTCHPFSHAQIICKEACTQILPCGHGCSRVCGVDCECDACELNAREINHLRVTADKSREDVGLCLGADVLDPANDTPLDIVEAAYTPFNPLTHSQGSLRPHLPAVRGFHNSYHGRGSPRGQGSYAPSLMHHSSHQQTSGAQIEGNYGSEHAHRSAYPRVRDPPNQMVDFDPHYPPTRGPQNRFTNPFTASAASAAQDWKKWDASAADAHATKVARDEESDLPVLENKMKDIFIQAEFTKDGKRKEKSFDEEEDLLLSFDGADERDERDEPASPSSTFCCGLVKKSNQPLKIWPDFYSAEHPPPKKVYRNQLELAQSVPPRRGLFDGWPELAPNRPASITSSRLAQALTSGQPACADDDPINLDDALRFGPSHAEENFDPVFHAYVSRAKANDGPIDMALSRAKVDGGPVDMEAIIDPAEYGPGPDLYHGPDVASAGSMPSTQPDDDVGMIDLDAIPADFDGYDPLFEAVTNLHAFDIPDPEPSVLRQLNGIQEEDEDEA